MSETDQPEAPAACGVKNRTRVCRLPAGHPRDHLDDGKVPIARWPNKDAAPAVPAETIAAPRAQIPAFSLTVNPSPTEKDLAGLTEIVVKIAKECQAKGLPVRFALTIHERSPEEEQARTEARTKAVLSAQLDGGPKPPSP